MKIPRFRSNTSKVAFDNKDSDLGFGTKLTEKGQRLINVDGTFNVLRVGMRSWNPYQELLEMSWLPFFLIILIVFCGINLVFALLYLLVGIQNLSGIGNTNFVENLANTFFFSVQTFTTVGYGSISPVGIPANIIASLNALVGLMGFALATGLFFARFSRPKAQIIFSKNAIIAPYQGGTSFQFRIANIRNNRVINLSATLSMSWIEDENGEKVRKFANLPLERTKVTLLPLNWTVVHPINESSPLWNRSPEDFRKIEAEFLILIQGFDDSFSQEVHSNSSYTYDDMLWDVRFSPMYKFDKKIKKTILELNKISDTLPA